MSIDIPKTNFHENLQHSRIHIKTYIVQCNSHLYFGKGNFSCKIHEYLIP